MFKGNFEYADVGKHLSFPYPYIIEPIHEKSVKVKTLSGFNADISLQGLSAFTMSFWARFDGTQKIVLLESVPFAEHTSIVFSGYSLYAFLNATGSISTLVALHSGPFIPESFCKYDIVFDVENDVIRTYMNGQYHTITTEARKPLTATVIANIMALSSANVLRMVTCSDDDAIQGFTIYEGALTAEDIYNSYNDGVSDNQHLSH